MQDGQSTQNVTLRRVRATTRAVEEHYVLYILSACVCVCVCVCLQPELSRTQSACAVLYCHMWHVQLYQIISTLSHSTAKLLEKILNTKNVCYNFLHNFCLKHFAF